MVKNIEIKNFLTFDYLKIDPLKRINLIGGKNNSGKTSLLEILLIYISQGESNVMNTVLNNRGQWESGMNDPYRRLMHDNIKEQPAIAKINALTLIYDENERSQLSWNGNQKELNINTNRHLTEKYFTYIPSNTDTLKLARLWDKIVFTDDEEEIIGLIQKIAFEKIDRIHISNNSVIAKINDKRVDIKTLGEGVSRILFIMTYLVSAKGKYFIIDEFENGLHYTVQEQLWDVIFEYAEKWNIQVFATTHSRDAIKSFKYACSKFEKDGKVDAQYIRLQKSRAGQFEAITYDNERLLQSLDLNLEIR